MFKLQDNIVISVICYFLIIMWPRVLLFLLLDLAKNCFFIAFYTFFIVYHLKQRHRIAFKPCFVS